MQNSDVTGFTFIKIMCVPNSRLIWKPAFCFLMILFPLLLKPHGTFPLLSPFFSPPFGLFPFLFSAPPPFLPSLLLLSLLFSSIPYLPLTPPFYFFLPFRPFFPLNHLFYSVFILRLCAFSGDAFGSRVELLSLRA